MLPAASPAPPIETDQPCLACGYNLRGLTTEDLCPECGSPAERSLRGHLLRYSSPDYQALLHRGVVLILAGIIISLVSTLAGVVAAIMASITALPGVEPALSLVGLAASVLSVVGWWMFSTPDPAFAGRDPSLNARRLVRATVVLNAAAALAAFLLQLGAAPAAGAASPAMMLTAALSLAVFVVWFFAAMVYVRQLAPRLPDRKVFNRAARLMWLGPLLYTVGLILLGLGPLIALILYYNLLDRVRTGLKTIRARGPHEDERIEASEAPTP